jgi:hypothetical protein
VSGSTNTPIPGWIVAPSTATTGFSADKNRLHVVVGGKSAVRFDAGSNPGCTHAYADGAGGTWLLCAGQIGRVDANGISIAPASSTVKAMYSGPTTGLWLALSTGAIERRPRGGGTATVYSDYLGSNFVSLAASSDANVWAVTADGGAARFNGTNWTTSMIPVAASEKVVGVAVSTSTVWAWTSKTLFKWNGSGWTTVALPTGTLSELFVVNDVPWLKVYDSSSKLYSQHGATWTLQRTFTSYGVLMTLDGANLVTLSASGSTATLERWSAGGPTTIATLVDTRIYGNNSRSLAMPTSSSIVFGEYFGVYRAAW